MVMVMRKMNKRRGIRMRMGREEIEMKRGEGIEVIILEKFNWIDRRMMSWCSILLRGVSE